MKSFLNARCCAYKLFSLYYQRNYIKGKSSKHVRGVDHMVQNTEKNYCKLQFL